MLIHFDKDRLAEVRDAHDRWRNGTLGRPLVSVSRWGVYAQSPSDTVPVPSQANCHDFSYSPSQIIRAVDHDMSDMRFSGGLSEGALRGTRHTLLYLLFIGRRGFARRRAALGKVIGKNEDSAAVELTEHIVRTP